MSKKSVLSQIKNFAPLGFSLVYLAACFLPTVSVSTGERFSVYALPFVNILQVLIYPACVLLIFALSFFARSFRESRSAFICVVSVANFVFLVLMPITLRRQIQLGWPGYWVVAGGIKMLFGYYLLYCLTIACLVAYFVLLRLRAQGRGKGESADA